MPPKKKGKGKKQASVEEPTDENPVPEPAEPAAADQIEEEPVQKKGKKKKGKGKKKGTLSCFIQGHHFMKKEMLELCIFYSLLGPSTNLVN